MLPAAISSASNKSAERGKPPASAELDGVGIVRRRNKKEIEIET